VDFLSFPIFSHREIVHTEDLDPPVYKVTCAIGLEVGKRFVELLFFYQIHIVCFEQNTCYALGDSGCLKIIPADLSNPSHLYHKGGTDEHRRRDRFYTRTSIHKVERRVNVCSSMSPHFQPGEVQPVTIGHGPDPLDLDKLFARPGYHSLPDGH